MKMENRQQGVWSLFLLKILPSRSTCTHEDVNGAIKSALSEMFFVFYVSVPEVSLQPKKPLGGNSQKSPTIASEASWGNVN